MPVIFRKRGIEINSKSFPFSFESRKEMITAVFGDSVDISDRYQFNAPFVKYLPPFVSIASWMLRQKIVAGYGKDYFTYTGDRAEGRMLKSYRMKPMVGERESISATSVKEAIYSNGGKYFTKGALNWYLSDMSTESPKTAVIISFLDSKLNGKLLLFISMPRFLKITGMITTLLDFSCSFLIIFTCELVRGFRWAR